MTNNHRLSSNLAFIYPNILAIIHMLQQWLNSWLRIGEAERFLVSVSVGWWEIGGDVDVYEEASQHIYEHKDFLIISDG